MSFNLRVCLYDPSAGDYASRFFGSTTDDEDSLPEPFTKLDGVSTLARCTDWAALQEHLRFGNIDVVVLNLDAGDRSKRFLPIQQITEVAPNCSIIGISRDSDPDTIIGAMRAGCSQFVRAPVDFADLCAAFDRIRQTRLPAGAGCTQIAVIGAHGGAGSTTIACNLALELAHVTNRRVGLIDMNLQFGDIACAFDRSPKYSVTDVCRDETTIDRTLLETALDELPCNVSILARPENLEDAVEVSEAAVERLFHTLAQMFPFVVADVPRYFSPPMLAASRAADRILIVSQLAVPFLRNAVRIQRNLLAAEVDEGRIEFVLNRASAEHERIKPAEVESHFGRKVFAVIPNDYKRVTASRDLGHPILAAAPNSPARLALQNLARQLIGQTSGQEFQPTGTRRRGFLGFLRRHKGTGREQPAPHTN